MAPEHVLLCYEASRRADAALLAAVELANASRARLTVLLHSVQPAPGRRCCGIQDAKWNELVGEALEDELTRAAKLVEGAGFHATVARVEGGSFEDAVSSYARQQGCDLVAVPARGLRPGGPFGRRTHQALLRTAPCPVVRLPHD